MERAEHAGKIVDSCEPTDWINYWTTGPCTFVMAQLDVRDGLFGTPALTEAWARSVMAHPQAYLQHRPAFFWNFLANANLTMWMVDVEDQSKIPLADRPAFSPVRQMGQRRARADAALARRLMAPGLHCYFRFGVAPAHDGSPAPSPLD